MPPDGVTPAPIFTPPGVTGVTGGLFEIGIGISGLPSTSFGAGWGSNGSLSDHSSPERTRTSPGGSGAAGGPVPLRLDPGSDRHEPRDAPARATRSRAGRAGAHLPIRPAGEGRSRHAGPVGPPLPGGRLPRTGATQRGHVSRLWPKSLAPPHPVQHADASSGVCACTITAAPCCQHPWRLSCLTDAFTGFTETFDSMRAAAIASPGLFARRAELTHLRKRIA